MSAGGGRQRGVAAVEFALLLPLLLAVLSVMALIIQTLLCYNAMQGAVQSAARCMAATSAGDMTRAARRQEAVTAARRIVKDAVAASGLPAIANDELIVVMCDNNPCGGSETATATIRVSVPAFELAVGPLRVFRENIGGTFTINTLTATVPYGG